MFVALNFGIIQGTLAIELLSYVFLAPHTVLNKLLVLDKQQFNCLCRDKNVLLPDP
jgi:hypothetical protein